MARRPYSTIRSKEGEEGGGALRKDPSGLSPGGVNGNVIQGAKEVPEEREETLKTSFAGGR